MKPLLIGEASNLPPGSEPLSGRTGAALAKMAWMSLEEFLVAFDRVNLLGRWPGRRPGAVKGHLFPARRASAAAARTDLTGRAVVLLGARVAAAFGLKRFEWLRPVDLGKGEAAAAVVPHPSGIVRWYNDEANRRAVGRLLRRMARCAASSARS